MDIISNRSTILYSLEWIMENFAYNTHHILQFVLMLVIDNYDYDYLNGLIKEIALKEIWIMLYIFILWIVVAMNIDYEL